MCKKSPVSQYLGDTQNYAQDFSKYEKHMRIAFNIVNSIPNSYLHSYLIVVLAYKFVVSFKKANRTTFTNEDDKFFATADIRHCIELLRRNKPKDGLKNKENLFTRYIYKWDVNFRFSSRVINAHMVGLLTLFYFFSVWVYSGFRILDAIKKFTPAIEYFLEEIKNYFDIEIPISIFLIRTDHILMFIATSILSVAICLVQSLLGLKGIKTSILQAYKGSYVTKSMSPVSLATGNIHFGGYLVGFLINGFIFIFIFILVFFFAIYYLFKYFSSQILSIFLTILPILVVYTVKLLFDYVCAKLIFLQSYGKHLALENYRSFSLLIYIMFFIDCFTGFLAALFRLLTGMLGSLLFMPRIGYSYLGRQIENYDTGFQVFNGYLNMEIGNSNLIKIGQTRQSKNFVYPD